MSGINLAPKESNLWKIVDAVRQLAQGRSNSTGVVTLRANQTTTVVSAQTCSPSSEVFLTAHTASAAASLLTTYVKEADKLLASFTITHTSDPATDRTYGFEARGGG